MTGLILIDLIAGHVVGDWLLQWDRSGLKKRSCFLTLVLHCLVYTLCIAAVLWMHDSLSAFRLAIVYGTHIVIDHREWKSPWSSYPYWSKIFDQFMHLVVLRLI